MDFMKILGRIIFLAIQQQDDPKKYHIVRPHLGHQSLPRYHNELKRRFKKISPSQAQINWEKKYQHGISTRKDSYGIISGSILTTCQILREKLDSSKLSIVRAFCQSKGYEERVVGILVPKDNLPALKQSLREHEMKGLFVARMKQVISALDPHIRCSVTVNEIKAIPSQKLRTFLTYSICTYSLHDVVEDVKEYLLRKATLYENFRQVMPQQYQSDNIWRQLEKQEQTKAFLSGFPIGAYDVVQNFRQTLPF